jgi:uncharacterized protein YdbL (DUF1318 family)
MITSEERGRLAALINHAGWQDLLSLIAKHRARHYEKLRNVRKAAMSYDRACGVLDGLDLAERAATGAIEEYDATFEQRNQEQEAENK